MLNNLLLCWYIFFFFFLLFNSTDNVNLQKFNGSDRGQEISCIQNISYNIYPKKLKLADLRRNLNNKEKY